ncbi:MAG: carboxypeptidase-like regulatory domain-containing protein, partial [Bryobacteraceae bacterium]
AQTVRLFADEPGRVALDEQQPKDLQEGQLILDGVKDGKHIARVTTQSGELSFTFDVTAGKAPAIDGPVAAKNLIAVLVTGSGNQAHITTSSPMLKIALDGQAQGEAGPGGLSLNNVTPGDHELAIGEGKDEKKLVVSFGPAPTLTAFLKSDVNAGTLVISTGEDDTSVFLNNKEYRRKTQRGQIRVQWLGNVSVRVSKPGFQDVPAQQASVKKGEETRLEFTLKALPKLAVLQIRGGVPGTQVLLDQQSLGAIGPDGTLSHAKVSPGDHVVELRRDRFAPKKLQRTFKAGETVALSGNDLILTAALASVQITVVPASAALSYRHADEPQSFDIKGTSVQLPTGVYTFTAKAPGFGEKSERVVVMAGETRSVDLRLSQENVAAPVTHIGTMADWREPGSWQKNEDGVFVHRGGNFVQYKITPTAGVFQFTVELLKGGGIFHGGRIRWFLNFKDARNYALFEMDKKNLAPKDVVDGKSTDREKAQHDEDPNNRYTMEIEVGPGRVITRVRAGQQWAVLDDWKEPSRDFTKGTFGFYIPGNDEIGLTNFRFAPAK